MARTHDDTRGSVEAAGLSMYTKVRHLSKVPQRPAACRCLVGKACHFYAHTLSLLSRLVHQRHEAFEHPDGEGQQMEPRASWAGARSRGLIA